MKNDEISKYIKKQKQYKIKIIVSQLALFFGILALWEFFSSSGLIDKFLFSSPSAIFNLFLDYLKSGELFLHIRISLLETLIGLVGGTVGGVLIAIALWWSKTLSKILDPFLVVLNALPKTALAPIIIIWAGTGVRGIVTVSISLAIVITILSAYNYFNNIEEEKIKMLQAFGASKLQILSKLVIPGNLINLINIIKINIGMSWVGVIVGEFIVSRAGIGYLVVYGGQVFRLDIVMMGVMILAILAYGMYQIVNVVEKYYLKKQGGRK